MFWYLFRVATLGKGALALSIVASAYGAGSLEMPEARTPKPSVHVEAAHETPRPQTTSLPAPTTEKPAPTAKPDTSTVSFEALLSECVARYMRGATNTKEACDRAIAASGLDTAAFAAKYGSLLVPPAPKTDRSAPTTKPATTATFEALLSECVARYKRAATNTKEACDRAIAASGLSTDAFVAKYRSLLVPPTKTEAPRATATPKPSTAPKLNTSDPGVRECLARYDALKTLKTREPQTFEAALATFNQTCKTVLGTRG